PLRLNQDSPAIVFGGFSTRAGADLTIYDFGAVSVAYTVPIEGPFEDLLSLSEELYDNESLLADSRLRVEELIRRIGDAAGQPHSSSVVEDYVIFHVEGLEESWDAELFCSKHARQIAQILRAERQALSDQEVEDALSARVSYGLEDVTVVDW